MFKPQLNWQSTVGVGEHVRHLWEIIEKVVPHQRIRKVWKLWVVCSCVFMRQTWTSLCSVGKTRMLVAQTWGTSDAWMTPAFHLPFWCLNDTYAFHSPFHPFSTRFPPLPPSTGAQLKVTRRTHDTTRGHARPDAAFQAGERCPDVVASLHTKSTSPLTCP